MGAAGAAGPQGASFTLATTLPSGQTEYGDYGEYGVGGGLVGGVVGFRIPLAQGIGATHTHFIAAQAFTPQCPGFQQAAAGELCVYQTNATNTAFESIFGTTGMTVGGTSTGRLPDLLHGARHRRRELVRRMGGHRALTRFDPLTTNIERPISLPKVGAAPLCLTAGQTNQT